MTKDKRILLSRKKIPFLRPFLKWHKSFISTANSLFPAKTTGTFDKINTSLTNDITIRRESHLSRCSSLTTRRWEIYGIYLNIDGLLVFCEIYLSVACFWPRVIPDKRSWIKLSRLFLYTRHRGEDKTNLWFPRDKVLYSLEFLVIS